MRNSPEELCEAHCGDLLGLSSWGSGLYGVMFLVRGGFRVFTRIGRRLFREEAMTVFLLVRRAHREMGRKGGREGGGERTMGGMGAVLYTVGIGGKGPGESAAGGHRCRTNLPVHCEAISHQPSAIIPT